jgi:putative transposase
MIALFVTFTCGERIMSGPKPQQIKLTEAEERELDRLINAHNTPQQIAKRAWIVRAAGAGKNNAEIAREIQVAISTVHWWRKRWLFLQAIPPVELSVQDRLEDLPRPGAPSGITADQMCQLVALACERPEESERPISHWTSREIADELMKRGIVESISPRHAGRLFKRSRSQTASNSLLADTGAG